MTKTFSVVVAANDEFSLAQNLSRSTFLERDDVELHVERKAVSASTAYNSGLDATSGPIVIFAHQDVYLPPNWADMLEQAIARVEETDPDWAIIAPFGMSLDNRHLGQVWSTSLGAVVGHPVHAPVPVQSVDELVIVMRRECGLRFDENLPNFHLYGTDIVQTAVAQSKGAYACNLPVVHNDHFHDHLRRDFAQAYHYLRRKWRPKLPVRTPVLWLDKAGLGLPIYRARAWRSVEKRRANAADTTTDPRVYSRRCGWETA